MIQVKIFPKLKFTSIFVTIFYLLLLIVCFWPAITAPPGQMLFGDDFFRSYYYYREFFRQSLLRGEIPWWNPYLFSGMPFMANPSISFFYPVNLFYLVLPLKWGYLTVTMLHMLWAALGVYWVSRNCLHPNTKPTAAVLGGIIYGFSGYFMARVWAGHGEILAAASWLPWVFGSFWRAFVKPSTRNILLSVFFLAVQIISGYQTIAMLTLEAVAIAAVVSAVIHKRLTSLLILGGGCILALGISAFILIPYVEFFRNSVRVFDFPYNWAARGSISWSWFMQLLQPYYFGNQYNFTGPPPNFHEQAAFISITGAGTGIVALILFYKDKFRRYNLPLILTAVLIIVFSLWVSAGPNAGVNLHKYLWDLVPLYRNIRIPSRHLLLFVFGSSLLATYGLSMLRVKWLQVLILMAAAVELFVAANPLITVKPIPGTDHDRELIARLTDSSEPARILQNFGVWLPARDALDFDAPPVYGIFSVTGYDPSILRYYYEFADAVNGKNELSLDTHDVQIPYLNHWLFETYFLNIKYLIYPADYDPLGGNSMFNFERIVFNEPKKYHLYINSASYPRFFLVPKLRVMPSRESVRQAVIDRKWQPKAEVLVSDNITLKFPLDCGQKPLPPVAVVNYSLNHIKLLTDTDCNSMLSTSEINYPGWRAFIDGKGAEIITSNMAFRSLIVPKGKHIITLDFRPVIFGWGSLVSASTFLFIFLAVRGGIFRKIR